MFQDSPKKIYDLIISSLDEAIAQFVSLDVDFASVGLNSLDVIKLIVTLEETFNIEFDDEMLADNAFSNIRALVEYVEAKISTL